MGVVYVPPYNNTMQKVRKDMKNNIDIIHILELIVQKLKSYFENKLTC